MTSRCSLSSNAQRWVLVSFYLCWFHGAFCICEALLFVCVCVCARVRVLMYAWHVCICSEAVHGFPFYPLYYPIQHKSAKSWLFFRSSNYVSNLFANSRKLHVIFNWLKRIAFTNFSDSRFTQQELPACKPILTPRWVSFIIAHF